MTAKYDSDGIQICARCAWPKGWDQEWQTDYCPECLCSECGAVRADDFDDCFCGDE